MGEALGCQECPAPCLDSQSLDSQSLDSQSLDSQSLDSQNRGFGPVRNLAVWFGSLEARRVNTIVTPSGEFTGYSTNRAYDVR
jgi:hypothetical protein